MAFGRARLPRRALLAFGGAKGANLALMVECLAAGLSGASWSLDMPDFQSGERVIDAGLMIITIRPEVLDKEFSSCLNRQLDRLAEHGTHVPGRRPVRGDDLGHEYVMIDTWVLEAIRGLLH